MKLTTKNCPLKAREEVQRILKEVFEGHEYTLNAEHYGYDGQIELQIQYHDFATTDWLRGVLERRIPGVQLSLYRWYSDTVVTDAMRELYDECIDVWTYDSDGHPVRLCINQLVEAWLADKEVRDGVAIYPRRAIAGSMIEDDEEETDNE